MQLIVLKRSGATEPFTRDKAISGVRKACKGRPVSEDDLACLGQTVEDALRDEGAAEVPAHEVGLAILGPLRELDQVAYLRFASVYRAFESADDFEDEIALLRMSRSRRAVEPLIGPRRPDGLTHRPPGVWWGSCSAGPTKPTGTNAVGAQCRGPVSRPRPPWKKHQTRHRSRDTRRAHDRDGERRKPRRSRPARAPV